MKTTASRITPWLPLVAYMVLTWFLSSLSSIPVSLDSVPFKDKGAHFIEYAIFGFLAAHAVRGIASGRSDRAVVLAAAAMGWTWGIIDEVHQMFVPPRSPSIYDFMADALGAPVGAALRVALSRWLRLPARR